MDEDVRQDMCADIGPARVEGGWVGVGAVRQAVPHLQGGRTAPQVLPLQRGRRRQCHAAQRSTAQHSAPQQSRQAWQHNCRGWASSFKASWVGLRDLEAQQSNMTGHKQGSSCCIRPAAPGSTAGTHLHLVCRCSGRCHSRKGRRHSDACCVVWARLPASSRGASHCSAGNAGSVCGQALC